MCSGSLAARILSSLRQGDSGETLAVVVLARNGRVGEVRNVFWWLGGIARLQVGDGSTKGIPTGSEAAFTDMENVLKVRRAFSELH